MRNFSNAFHNMKLATRLGLIACLLLAFAASQAAARDIKLATYNVENMFDSYDDPYTGDIDNYNHGVLMTKPVAELKALSEVIHTLNADVLGLQEVENRGFLEEFNEKYLADMGYRYLELVEGNDRRGIDVAVLSRYPLGPVVSYRHLALDVPYAKEPKYFSRDLLQVELRPPGAKPFTVYVAHLKSRSGGKQATWQREGEARKIRQIWDYRLKAQPKSLFVLMTDANDDPPSGTVRILEGSGKVAVRPVNAKAPDGSEWTEHSRNSTKYPPIRFDYLFMSPAMRARVKASGVLRGSDDSAIYRAARSASDHFPVWAVVNL